MIDEYINTHECVKDNIKFREGPLGMGLCMTHDTVLSAVYNCAVSPIAETGQSRD